MGCTKRERLESALYGALARWDKIERKKGAAVTAGDPPFGRFDSAIVQADDNVKKAQRALQQHKDMCKICSAKGLEIEKTKAANKGE